MIESLNIISTLQEVSLRDKFDQSWIGKQKKQKQKKINHSILRLAISFFTVYNSWCYSLT